MDFAEFIDVEMSANHCPWTANASFYCGVGWLITMEK